MSTETQTKITRSEADKLVGTIRNGGKVIGITNRPTGTLPEANGVYLIISHRDRKASYERVG